MAENKKGFILYADLWHTFEHLTNEQRGEVITWVLQFVNDMGPAPLPGLLAAVVAPIEQQLKRDLRKYETRAQRSRENGALGGRPPNPKKPKKTQEVKEQPRKPDTVSVTVNDKVTGTDNEISILKLKIETYLIGSFTWKEAVIRKLKTNGITIELINLDRWVLKFCTELEATEDVYKTERECKSHFTHWVSKQLKNDTTTNKKQTRHETTLDHNKGTAEELGLN